MEQPSLKQLLLCHSCCHMLLLLFVALGLLNRKSCYTTRQLDSACWMRDVYCTRRQTEVGLPFGQSVIHNGDGTGTGAEACWQCCCQDSSRTAIYALASSCGIQCPVSCGPVACALPAAAAKLRVSSLSLSLSDGLEAFFL